MNLYGKYVVGLCVGYTLGSIDTHGFFVLVIPAVIAAANVALWRSEQINMGFRESLLYLLIYLCAVSALLYAFTFDPTLVIFSYTGSTLLFGLFGNDL